MSTRVLAAAVHERSETVAERDARLIQAVHALREQLAASELSDDKLRLVTRLAGEWSALVDQRLELAASQTALVGQILAATRSERVDVHTRVDVLKAQVAQLESIALSVTTSAAILEAITQFEEVEHDAA